MGSKGRSDLRFSSGSIRQIRVKLPAALLTDAAQVRRDLHDAEFAACHASILPPSRESVDFKWHHYQIYLGQLPSHRERGGCGLRRRFALSKSAPSHTFADRLDRRKRRPLPRSVRCSKR